MPILYKGVEINKIFMAGNDVRLGPYGFTRPSSIMNCNSPYGALQDNQDITTLAACYNQTFTNSGTHQMLPQFTFKSISAIGISGGGGGGGKGGSSRKNDNKGDIGGSFGGSGYNGTNFNMYKVPINGNEVKITVGSGGDKGNNGENNKSGKGKDGNGGNNGGTTSIEVNGTTIISVSGGNCGNRGGAAQRDRSGENGNDGTAGTINVNPTSSSFPNTERYRGLNYNDSFDTNIYGVGGLFEYNGKGGYVRVYLHYD